RTRLSQPVRLRGAAPPAESPDRPGENGLVQRKSRPLAHLAGRARFEVVVSAHADAKKGPARVRKPQLGYHGLTAQRLRNSWIPPLPSGGRSQQGREVAAESG